MEKCSRCGADTVMFYDGVPICIECDEKIERIRKPQYSERREPVEREKPEKTASNK